MLPISYKTTTTMFKVATKSSTPTTTKPLATKPLATKTVATSSKTVTKPVATTKQSATTKKPAANSEESALSMKYQKKSDVQHILDVPDTYIGSIETVEMKQWVYDDEENKVVKKSILFNPGLYKLFDEGIVNCRDHVIR